MRLCYFYDGNPFTENMTSSFWTQSRTFLCKADVSVYQYLIGYMLSNHLILEHKHIIWTSVDLPTVQSSLIEIKFNNPFDV